MNALVIADEKRRNEFVEKVKSKPDFRISFCEPNETIDNAAFHSYEVIVDLSFNGNEDTFKSYAALQNRIVIVNAVTCNLNAFYSLIESSNSCIIGINALPTFINKPIAEICLPKAGDLKIATSFFSKLEWDFEVVACRVGMVTPRVVSMIINEACYTFQEGTASQADIDQAMKLGTNYPFGPFEWANRIGIAEVYSVIEAMYEDTKEERYKCCPLLKTQYLRNEAF